MTSAANLRVLLLTVLLATLLPGPTEAKDREGWQQIDDDDGIRVYKHDIPGRDLPGFRGEAVIEAPIEHIVAELQDYSHYTEWMHDCVAAERLADLGNGRSIDYNRTDAPWPVWDRDVVLESQWTFSPDGRLAVLDFHDTTAQQRKLPGHTVRMPHLVGFYRLWKLEPSKTQVVYQVEADPGGSLPTWLAKRVTRDLPFDTLRALRKRVTHKH